MEENDCSQVYVVTGNVSRILRHTFILMKLLELIPFGVDGMCHLASMSPSN